MVWFSWLNCQNLYFNLHSQTIYSNKSLDMWGRNHRSQRKATKRVLGQRFQCPPKATEIFQLWDREPLKGPGSSAKQGLAHARQGPVLQLPREAACPLQPALAHLGELTQRGLMEGQGPAQVIPGPYGLCVLDTGTLHSPTYQNFCVWHPIYCIISLNQLPLCPLLFQHHFHLAFQVEDMYHNSLLIHFLNDNITLTIAPS